MSHLSKHLSDEDILLLLDRELSHAEAESTRKHLTYCTECSSRLAAKRNTSDALSELFTPQASNRSSLRSDLQRRLHTHTEPPTSMQSKYLYRALAACLLLAAAGLGFYGGHHRFEVKATSSHAADAHSTPNLSLTPGAVRPVTLTDICSAASEDDDLDPALPPSIQNAVLEEYGIAAKGLAQNYQIDYLVNPQLGGTNDIRNLWPQAYQGGVWNARAKDQLEERLHQLVCDRTVDLATAQREIMTDWIAAYKKYLHEPTPRT